MPFYLNFRSQRFVATSVFVIGESASLFLVYVCRGHEYLPSLFIGASSGLALAYGSYLVNDTFLPPPNEIPVLRDVPWVIDQLRIRYNNFVGRILCIGENHSDSDSEISAAERGESMRMEAFTQTSGSEPHHAIEVPAEEREEESGINAQESIIFQPSVSTYETDPVVEGPPKKKEESANDA